MGSQPLKAQAEPQPKTTSTSPPTLPFARSRSSVRLWPQLLFAAAAAGLFLVTIYLVRDFLGAFVLGGVIAFVISPLLDVLEHRGVPRVLGAIGTFVVLAALVVALVGMLMPLLTTEVVRLQSQGPTFAASLQEQLALLHRKPFVVLGIRLDLSKSIQTLENTANSLLIGQVFTALTLGVAALSTLMQAVLALIVAFLLAMNGARIASLARSLVPSQYRSDFDHLGSQLRSMLRNYLKGELIIAALIGLTSGVAVWLLGLDFPVALGVLAGITALIPYLGPFIGGVPAILIALAISPEKAILVAVAYILISNLVLNFVYPKVVGDAVQLPALVIIVAFIAGFSFAGVLGMFVAVPVAAAIRILFEFLYPRVYLTADSTT